jgi:hypothetical protein
VRKVINMKDEKSGTSPEFAKLMRDAHVPTEVGETSPEHPGESHGSGELQNRPVHG